MHEETSSAKEVVCLLLSTTRAARNVPEAEAEGAAFLGAAFGGVSDLVLDLLANCEPTALSKNPPPVTEMSIDQ